MVDKRLIQNLTVIPGVGKSIAHDLWNIGMRNVSDLAGQDPELLYDLSNHLRG
jgi:predicted flap endonuclease-1-like 5' DNA nuclease